MKSESVWSWLVTSAKPHSARRRFWKWAYRTQRSAVEKVTCFFKGHTWDRPTGADFLGCTICTRCKATKDFQS